MGTSRVMTLNGACPIKRRRGRAAMAELRQSIYDVIKADRPMTVRQVFCTYRRGPL
jgi:hypothetical protein